LKTTLQELLVPLLVALVVLRLLYLLMTRRCLLIQEAAVVVVEVDHLAYATTTHLTMELALAAQVVLRMEALVDRVETFLVTLGN
jgi:hypothetical protein